MLKFLKSILSTALGMVIGFMLILFIGFGIIAVTTAGDEEVEVADNSILKITLNQSIIDRSNENPFNFDILNLETLAN